MSYDNKYFIHAVSSALGLCFSCRLQQVLIFLCYGAHLRGFLLTLSLLSATHVIILKNQLMDPEPQTNKQLLLFTGTVIRFHLLKLKMQSKFVDLQT